MFALRVPTKTVSLDFNEITAYFESEDFFTIPLLSIYPFCHTIFLCIGFTPLVILTKSSSSEPIASPVAFASASPPYIVNVVSGCDTLWISLIACSFAEFTF